MQVPFRDSKLTKLLADCLGGNSHTTLVATVGPLRYNTGETLSTLLFAQRCMDITTSATVNAVIDYREMCEALRMALAASENEHRQREAMMRAHYEQLLRAQNSPKHAGAPARVFDARDGDVVRFCYGAEQRERSGRASTDAAGAALCVADLLQELYQRTADPIAANTYRAAAQQAFWVMREQGSCAWAARRGSGLTVAQRCATPTCSARHTLSGSQLRTRMPLCEVRLGRAGLVGEGGGAGEASD